MYVHMFNNEFNIGFHIPNENRCDICEQFIKNVKFLRDVELQENEAHIQS